MSHIAGILGRRFPGDGLGELKSMFSSFSSLDSVKTLISPGLCLGWVGPAKPNFASQKGIFAVMDGFIYNRSSWEKFSCDAELLIELFFRHGMQGALERINGDFSFALYDKKNACLYLARDRFGVKPLYYAKGQDFFAFASRPSCLFALPGISPEPRKKFVGLFAGCHYRYFDNDPECSPYQGISQLPAAHLLRVSETEIQDELYWKLEDVPDFTRTSDELSEEYRGLLFDSVKIRLESAVHPGFMLSGGMDSSSVLTSAVRILGSPQPAFSSVYEDKTYDESRDIQSLISSAVSSWHPIRVTGENLYAQVMEMISKHDEPVATATWLSHYLVCQAAKAQGIGGLFGGLGGDELNAGEYEHFFYFFSDLRRKGMEKELSEEMEMWIQYHDHPIFHKNREVMERGLSTLVDLSRPGRCRVDQERLLRYASALNSEYFDLSSFRPRLEHPFQSYLKNRSYQDIFFETAPCCLRAEDRQSSAFGLEHFDPFYDYRLVEFMFRVPERMKIRQGVTKFLLRKAMNGVLPDETRKRVKKTGWNAPAHQWFSGKGSTMLMDLVHSSAFKQRGIYRVDEVIRLIEEHDEIVRTGQARDNHMMFLWQLFNLELWFRWMNGK